MLKNIEIINQTEIMITQHDPNCMLYTITDNITNIIILILLIFSIIDAIFVTIIMFTKNLKEDSWLYKLIYKVKFWKKVIISMAILCVILIITTFTRIIDSKNHLTQTSSGRYEYEIVIDDDTTLKELKEIYTNYEVIEMKYDIWIIQDKGE